MIRTRRLAGWVGQGRRVTPKGVLRPADVPAAADALGVSVPTRIRTAADVEVIHRPWVAAQALELIRVGADRAIAQPAVDADGVERWWAAVAAVLRAESHDDRGRGAAVLCRTLLMVLATEPPPAVADLTSAVDEVLHFMNSWDAGAVYQAFRRGVMPVDACLDLLAEIGAVDGQGRIIRLGRWLRERLVDEMPPPVSPDLPATDVLTRLAGLADDDMWRQAGRWLSGREAGVAAEELLAAAAIGPAAQRVVAVDVVAGVGEPALPAWRRALEDPMLAPHARSVLADLDDGRAPELADRRWLAVEFALVALDEDGPQEAYHLLNDMDALDAIDASGHPEAGILRAGLADLLAGGGPRVPDYQLRIALNRMRPPVWRRVRVPATTTLDDLHRVIQVLFDWDDDHLHVFTVDGRRYADPFFELDDCADEARVRLGKVLHRAGGSMRYVYDLGDWWEHQITLERVIESDATTRVSICVGGQGDAPVEDWFPGCDRKSILFDTESINRRLARIHEPDDELVD